MRIRIYSFWVDQKSKISDYDTSLEKPLRTFSDFNQIVQIWKGAHKSTALFSVLFMTSTLVSSTYFHTKFMNSNTNAFCVWKQVIVSVQTKSFIMNMSVLPSLDFCLNGLKKSNFSAEHFDKGNFDSTTMLLSRCINIRLTDLSPADLFYISCQQELKLQVSLIHTFIQNS